jgi:hypothetical protein
LEGKVVLITGASSGIGAATAEKLAENGCHVAIAARRKDRLQRLAETLQGRSTSVSALPISLDVSDPRQVKDCVDEVLTHFGTLDVLFNNAGIGRLDWLEELGDAEGIEAPVQTNLLGTIRMTKAVLPTMQAQRSGHIINMASLAAYVATPTYSIYAAAKFGVRGFSEALRREVAAWGIQVSTLLPGAVDTDFGQKAGIHRRTGITTPAWLLLSIDEVAEAVLKLILHPKPIRVMPKIMLPIIWLNRLWPGLIDWLSVRRFVMRERPEELRGEGFKRRK